VPDQLGVAGHKADPPAGHVVALGEREELDRDVLGARHLQDRRRHVAVEHDVRIGEIVDHPDAVLLGDRNHLLEEIQLHALRGRIAGKLSTSIFGFGQAFLMDFSSSAKKSPSGTSGTWRMSAPAITKP